MNVYVTAGKNGNGHIAKALVEAGFKRLSCDVVDENSVERAMSQVKPDLILHLAGSSDPDYCESHQAETSKVNVRGTHNVVESCVRRSIPAVLLSSAQIWKGGMFERHTEDSPRTPAVNIYGMQKTAAEGIFEVASFAGYKARIVRTSFVFSRERLSGKLHDLKNGVAIDAPRFLKRSFIHIDDFVSLIICYCENFDTIEVNGQKGMPQILHLAGSKTVSYHTFWTEVCKQYGFDPKLVKGRWLEKDIVEGEKKAKRPHNAGLDVSLSKKLGFPQFDYIGGIERMKNES